MSGILAPLNRTTHGLHTYLRGVRWLKQHPKYLFYLFIPMMIGLGLLVMGWQAFVQYEDQIFATILFDKPESWWAVSLYYICKAILYIVFLATSLLSFVLFTNVLACPVYEVVSVAVERELSGGNVVEVSLWQSLKLIGEELKKVLFILLVSLVLLLIPGINILATLVTAFLVGWDFYDYPLARRGWSFRERFKFVAADFWSVMGFGLWLMIPFVQIFLLPMAVAGGTMLCLETLNERQQGR